MLLRKRHQIPVEVETRDIRGRIGGIADHDRQRLRNRMEDGALNRLEELRRRLRGYRADHAPGHQKSKGMNRIAWIGTQHDVARRGDRLGHVGKALLRAQRRDDLALRVEFDAETAAIIGRLSFAQAGNAA